MSKKTGQRDRGKGTCMGGRATFRLLFLHALSPPPSSLPGFSLTIPGQKCPSSSTAGSPPHPPPTASLSEAGFTLDAFRLGQEPGGLRCQWTQESSQGPVPQPRRDRGHRISALDPALVAASTDQMKRSRFQFQLGSKTNPFPGPQQPHVEAGSSYCTLSI